jgi:hypothetical protein
MWNWSRRIRGCSTGEQVSAKPGGNACLQPQKMMPGGNGKGKARDHPEIKLAEVGCTGPFYGAKHSTT